MYVGGTRKFDLLKSLGLEAPAMRVRLIASTMLSLKTGKVGPEIAHAVAQNSESAANAQHGEGRLLICERY